MSSSFFGVETGSRALRTAQAALDTASHNIANANTPGYSRQRVETQTTDPFAPPSLWYLMGAGQIGTGAQASAITQARDAHLDRSVRDGYSGQGAALARGDALAQVEEAVGEPGPGGINAALTGLFNSFHDLASHPESAPLRNATVASAGTVAGAFGRVAGRLDDLAASLDQKAQAGVDQINNIGRRIAALNKEIRVVLAQGAQPNDLRDQQNLLLDQLAKTANTTALPQPDGTLTVQIGGVAVVRGSDALPVSDIAALTMGGDLAGGELRGLVDARKDLDDVRGKLDGLANAFRDQVNTLHQGGLDKNGSPGVALFSGTNGAGDLAVNAAVAADASLVAASANKTPFAAGNGDNALALAGLATGKVTGGAIDNETLRDYWGGAATTLGVEVKALQAEAENNDAFVRQTENRRDAISGVSLDDEMADMVRFQRAYQAAARVISMADELTGSIIEMAGGRA